MQRCTDSAPEHRLWPHNGAACRRGAEGRGREPRTVGWSRSTNGPGVAVSQTEHIGAAGRITVGPDGLCRSISGGPVINVLAAAPNHSRLHKFGRPGSAAGQHSDRLKGGKGPAATDVTKVQACPLPAPMPACIHQSPRPKTAGEPLAKPQDSRQNPVLFHLRRQSLSTHLQPNSMTSSSASCSPFGTCPLPASFPSITSLL